MTLQSEPITHDLSIPSIHIGFRMKSEGVLTSAIGELVSLGFDNFEAAQQLMYYNSIENLENSRTFLKDFCTARGIKISFGLTDLEIELKRSREKLKTKKKKRA